MQTLTTLYSEFMQLHGKYNLSFINADKPKIEDSYCKVNAFMQL